MREDEEPNRRIQILKTTRSTHKKPSTVMSSTSTARDKAGCYQDTRRRIGALLNEKTDWVAAMATVACELHHSFAHYDWTGFYRPVGERTLLVGPYQGPHGCLRVDFGQGVCGAAARTRETQVVPDVGEASDYIACQSSTRSELVVPILTPEKELLAVLDVDSDTLGAFGTTDQEHLEALSERLGERFGKKGWGAIGRSIHR
jgi:GAF domain-containing protein